MRLLLRKLFNTGNTFKVRFYPKFNRLLFYLHGIQHGKNLRVFDKVLLNVKGYVQIGHNFMFTSSDGINPISSNLQGCMYVEKTGTVEIGDNVGMSSTRMWISNHLTIGNHVKVGACCLIIDTDTHQIDYLQRRKGEGHINSAPITIEDDVWIGAHCIVLKGVTIGARSIIGAGSVVTKDIPADCIAAGNPCRVIRNL